MAILRSQFNQGLANIEINGKKADRAKAAHQEIRSILEADTQLHEWGVDTILIGSYSRDTGIYPGKDVDVFVKLTEVDTGAMPKDVYNAVWDALVREYGDADDGGRAAQQARSIKVAFPDEDDPGDDNASFSIDSVPAVKDGVRWAIPTKDRSRWTGGNGRWVTTDPEQFGTLSSVLSTSLASPAVGDRNAYKPIVKLTRQARRIHVGDRRPGGLYIEFIVYEAWNAGLVAGTDWDPLFAQTLRCVADRLTVAPWAPLLDPALGTPVEPSVAEKDLTDAAEAFRRLADLADNALVADNCEAAAKWREILGGNDRADPVFPWPPGCGGSGAAASSTLIVARRGRQEAQGFG
ncbi:MAG: nucleotidyltransferase [Thermoflexaceae bacterium]|nr:nucleotidyltransferase [Thermoflexaceae bacterium]